MSTYHGVNARLAFCLYSVLNVCLQPGEGPSRDILRDYEPSCGPSFEALMLEPVTNDHDDTVSGHDKSPLSGVWCLQTERIHVIGWTDRDSTFMERTFR